MGVSEDVFWNADYSFILSVIENKNAFDGFLNYAKYKESERINSRKP